MSTLPTSCHCAPGSRLEISGPHGPGRWFRVDLVRGDNGKRVCQSLAGDYGAAILRAGEMAGHDLPVVDAVADKAAPGSEARGCR